MPELPEVETVRRQLHTVVVGATVVQLRADGARTFRRQGGALVAGAVTGRTVVGTGRHGKYLWLALDDATRLVVHLRMSGQLLAVPTPPPADAPEPKHTHAVLTLDAGPTLRFVDPRTFGEIYVIRAGHEADDGPEQLRMGPDALAVVHGTLRPADLGRRLRERRVPLKGWLVDQRRIAGIGNIYADEICHEARVDPFRRTDTLSDAVARRLHAAIGTVLTEAIEAGGSSLADEQYVDLFGVTGRYQRHHRVHARAGQPCPRCGLPVQRTTFQARGSYACPRCQGCR